MKWKRVKHADIGDGSLPHDLGECHKDIGTNVYPALELMAVPQDYSCGDHFPRAMAALPTRPKQNRQ